MAISSNTHEYASLITYIKKTMYSISITMYAVFVVQGGLHLILLITLHTEALAIIDHQLSINHEIKSSAAIATMPD
jgi:hypothetical protein